MSFSRREFTKLILGAVALGLVEKTTVARVFGQTKRSLLWLASQTANSEGKAAKLKIEGKLPKSLNGNLFRTTPGQSENFGTPLNHLFDGDAYLSSWQLKEGKAELLTRFLPTPSRMQELKAQKMLFNEYGTFAENRKNQGKNQPSVNVVEWNGKLLGLSEGGLPTIINPSNFDFEGYEDFQKAIPNYLTFTAHPRFDSQTGDMFAWGVEKRPPGTLHLYQIQRKNNQAKLLYKIPLNGFYMIHDSMLTENYFLLAIPPMQYDVQGLMSGSKTLGEALTYNEKLPTRLLLLPRNNQEGKAQPIEIEMPSEIVFHYGNAFETADGKIIFEMVSGNDKNLLENLRTWKRNYFSQTGELPQTLKQVTIDVAQKRVTNTVELLKEVEFPRYDLRLTGKKSRFLYVTENAYGENAAIVKVDLKSQKMLKANAGKSRTFGEPVFVPKNVDSAEDNGWLLTQGYDGDKNESFLEILDAQTLGFVSRIWALGLHFPLGFHGNFYASQK